ncbi:MAG: hypothetical protein GDA56_19500 [Hormoscilla sp. GM7CHS1pb]|nr:hypothetical protein [Hormoscilla sp. GM7CHS1pb]
MGLSGYDFPGLLLPYHRLLISGLPVICRAGTGHRPLLSLGPLAIASQTLVRDIGNRVYNLVTTIDGSTNKQYDRRSAQSDRRIERAGY